MAKPKSKPLAIFIGTRPEAIKLAPVCTQLDRLRVPYKAYLIGQQAMAGAYLKEKGLTNIIPIDTGRAVGDLIEFHAAAFDGLAKIYWDEHSIAVVQGDTATSFSAALAAYVRRIPVAHVEAGLRSSNRHVPFPEEANRRMIAQLATYHFTPTFTATNRLMEEGIHDGVWETGNTGIDALRDAFHDQALPQDVREILAWVAGHPLVLLTFHRRESWTYLTKLVSTLKTLPDTLRVVWPVHPNPRFMAEVARLQDAPHVKLVGPLPHGSLAHLIYHAAIVVTDSGGMIEESADLDRPCLILRNETERPEALDDACELFLLDRLETLGDRVRALKARKRSSRGRFGDGRAAERIALIFRATLDRDAWK